MICPGQSIGDNGHLFIGGVDTEALVKKYSTPLYVMDENVIRDNMRAYREAFEKYYNSNGRAYYASKAFCCKEMCRIAHEQGLGLDVVSGGELYTAMSVQFPAELINFHGNNKTADEIASAVRYGVGRIIVDSFYEIELINDVAKQLGTTVSVSLRIKPGVEAHTHEYIRTGQIDSKFGFVLDSGEAMKAVKTALTYKNIKLCGVHCHIGSQIFELDPFKDAAKIMLDLIKDVKNTLDYEIEELNLGGGFGIKYVDSDAPKPFGEYIKTLCETVKDYSEEIGIKAPFVAVEPGRSIVGEAGVTLYTVGGVKEIPNVRTYVSVDGGMCDNIRYALYKSEYTILNALRASEPKDSVYTIAGKCCESGDLIGENISMQKTFGGDILAVLSTGAYNYSMASNYNRIPRPAVVMIKDGTDRIVINRESYENIIANDI